MLAFVSQRVLGAIPTLALIVGIAFFMMRLAPGGPFDEERSLPEAIEANLRAAYQLDRPLSEQFLSYVGRLLQGDLGPSFKYQDFTVGELIAQGFPVSFQLGAGAILIGAVLGVLIGALAAWRQNSRLDHLLMAGAMTGIAVPNFVMAPLLTLVFGVWLAWLPVAGWRGPVHWILPTAALALPQVAYVARLTRGSMVEVMRSNFVRTARAKGMPERVVLFRHALKGGLLPVVSYLGPATAGIITGSVVIEQIFQIPGIGRYFIQGALNRDYTLVMGVVVFYGGLIVACNLVVDLVYGWLDPRVSYES